MSKKGIRLLAAGCIVLVLITLISQAKYIEPAKLYYNCKELFEDSVLQLQFVLNNITRIGDDVPKEEADSLKVECALYSEDIGVTICQYQIGDEMGCNPDLVPAWGYNYVEQPVDLAPDKESDLYEVLTELREIGIRHIEVHDFTSERPDRYNNPSSCEIWYVLRSGKCLIYSGNGHITVDYDLINDPGYGLYRRQIAPSWFAGDSYYDSNSDYWKG